MLERCGELAADLADFVPVGGGLPSTAFTLAERYERLYAASACLHLFLSQAGRPAAAPDDDAHRLRACLAHLLDLPDDPAYDELAQTLLDWAAPRSASWTVPRDPVVPERVAALDRLLGDPADPANPVGTRAVLDADERGEMPTAGERALDAYGLNAEFVPPEYGGLLTRADHLVEVMRTVYRRDPVLGLGYGASSFIAGVNVWTAAGTEQATRVADLLLGGHRVAVAFHELAHGNDMTGTEFTAAADGAHLRLSGRKEVVTNISRAKALVVLARTDPRPGPAATPSSWSTGPPCPATESATCPGSAPSACAVSSSAAWSSTRCACPARRSSDRSAADWRRP
ncbi:hypothetical protein ACFQ3Z_01690 [Streptomyces nogalater]